MIKPWSNIRSQYEKSFRVFSIRIDTAISPRTSMEHDFYIIESNDWVNIVPITSDQHVVMVRQFRHGSKKVTLEIPGGLLDNGDTPLEAAKRELLEETGFESDDWTEIGVVSPNPAIFSNRCYTFLAKNVKKLKEPAPDQTEDIEVVLKPLKDIPHLVFNGEIDHALVVTAFFWYLFHEKDPDQEETYFR